VILRRGSDRGFALLAGAVICLFIPLAAASSSDRATQTLTLVALMASSAAFGITWLILRGRGCVRAAYLGLASLAGAFLVVWASATPGFADATEPDLTARLAIVATLDGIGLWLFVLGLRRAFPRRVRAMATAAVVLLCTGLAPGPLLLLQPSVQALHFQDVTLQLRAGYLFWTVGASILVLPFLALLTVPGDWFERWWAAAVARVMGVAERRFAAGIVVVTLAVTIFFAIYSFDRRPTTADEIAQLWHARMLLSGALAMPPDPNPEFFAIDNVIDRPRWMSQFPIGGPAFLAIGLLPGVVWLLNPLLTALTALNVYRFAQRAYGEAQARAAAVVFVASPMVLVMGATHMNHTPTAWLVTLALATLPLWFTTSDASRLHRSAAIVGVTIGAAITLRPLDGFVAAVVMGLTMLAAAARDRVRARSLVVAMAGGTLPVALLLAANWATTGHPLRFGYEVLWGANHSLGLHDDPTGNPHTPWRAFLLAIKYAAQLNWIGAAWPIPLLLVLSVGLLFVRRARRWDALLLSYFGAQLFVYAFYWHDGQFVGPRFLFTALPAVLLLAARAPFLVSERVRGAWRRIALAAIPVCIAVAWFRSMPPFGVQAFAKEFRESRTRLKVDPPEEIESGAIDRALVFVQEGASARLHHRLWGIGVSRPDAARLLAYADACSLLEAVRAEERLAPSDTAGRLVRIEHSIRPYRASDASPRAPDHNFRMTDTTSITTACADEIQRDLRVHNTVAYGPMLLLNRFDAQRRIGGRAVYVMDLGERNELLRARFGNRRWFRYEIPRSRPASDPVLVPYDAPR
jgi:hypothetical protein